MLVAKVFSSAAAFHTAAALRSGLASKKLNIRHTKERLEAQEANRPSVILGTRPQDEEKLWPECALAKCLVNAQVLNGCPPIDEDVAKKEELTEETKKWGLHGEVDVPDIGTVTIPKAANYGVGPVEKQLLIKELPAHSAKLPFEARDSPFTSVFDSQLPKLDSAELANRWEIAQKREAAKLEAFSKVIDLRNANAKGIAYENRRRIILEFSDPKNPYDPGRAEVQAALLTYKIRNLWNHLTTSKRDVVNRRGLRKLIHQRAKILKYIKNKSRDRYDALLPRLALDPAGVEGELVV